MNTGQQQWTARTVIAIKRDLFTTAYAKDERIYVPGWERSGRGYRNYAEALNDLAGVPNKGGHIRKLLAEFNR